MEQVEDNLKDDLKEVLTKVWRKYLWAENEGKIREKKENQHQKIQHQQGFSFPPLHPPVYASDGFSQDCCAE